MIFERLSSREYTQQAEEALLDYSSAGLRTLCFADKNLSKEEFADWQDRMQAATLEGNSEKKKDLIESIESSLKLRGISGVEDKLQDGVPAAISDFLKAGIKVWMCTGDKLETSISVGQAAGLLKPNIPLLHIREDSLGLLFQETVKPYSLIVNGDTLEMIFESKDLTQHFFEKATSSFSVICSRLTPHQKSFVVEQMKGKTTSLSIGDGLESRCLF